MARRVLLKQPVYFAQLISMVILMEMAKRKPTFTEADMASALKAVGILGKVTLSCMLYFIKLLFSYLSCFNYFIT